MRKIAIAVAALALTATGCATASTSPDMVALHYEGGAVSAKKFKDCLDPSSRSGFDPGDNYFGYPTRQVSYDATGGEGSESDPFRVVSDDNAELYVPATVTFQLKTDCETLRKMHETIGSRYAAYYDANGDTSDKNEGWVRMLDFVIGKPLDATLDRVAQEYEWRSLWSEPEAKAAMEKEANAQIQALVARQAGGDFFEEFSILLQKPDPVNQGLKDAIALEQTRVAEAQAAEAQAKADQARAEAQLAVSEAEAAKQRAAIEGFMLKGMNQADAMEAYLRQQAIVAGLNPWQPTYKVNDTR